MYRQTTRPLITPGGTIVPTGTRVTARPSRRLGTWVITVPGLPRPCRVSSDALEPIDDIDLPPPEDVSPRALAPSAETADPLAWPVAALAIVAMLLVMVAA